MARTLNGSLTGRAAREEASDLAEYNYEQRVKEERARLEARENELLDAAIPLPGFDEFWAGVPTFGKRRDRIAMLEDFIATHSPTLPQKDSPPTDGRTA